MPLVLLLVLGLAVVGHAQVVEVRVRGDGAPLRGAVVTVGSLESSTDTSGITRVVVGHGSHWIAARKVGWLPDSLQVEVRGDTSVTLNLRSAPTELAELVVSSNRTARKVEDEALRVEILDAEEIEEKQLMTPGDIVMMLNETGGVRTATTNPSLGAAGIRIRGLKGRYTQVLADGLPLFGERVGSFGPLQIPPVDLGQVELIKGPASALFGGAAMGGLVNLLTREIEPGGTLLVNGTSLGGADAVTFLGGGLGNGWRYTGLAGLHGQTRQDRDNDGWLDVPGYQRIVVRPRLLWRDDRGQSLLVTLGSMVESRNGGTADGATAPDGRPFPERVRTARLDGGMVGRWRTSSTGPWLQARFSGSSLRHRHRFGTRFEPDHHATWFGEVSLNRDIAGFDWVVGSALVLDRFHSEMFPRNDYRYQVPGLFALLERDVGRAVFAASARLDHHSRFGTYLSPRFSALWRPADAWSVRASVGLGYYAPTPLIEETERVGLSLVVPPDQIRGERAASGSLDLHGVFGTFEINASVFATRVSDPVLARHPVGLGLIELVNAAVPTWARGTDLSLRYRRKSVSITASYALVSSREFDPDAGTTRGIPLTPRHTAGLVGTYEPPAGRVGLELYYTGGQVLDDNPYRGSGRPFLVVGALVERRFGAVGLFLNGENLLDVRQTDFDRLVRPSPGRGGSWTTDAWAPLDGRVINGGVRWTW